MRACAVQDVSIAPVANSMNLLAAELSPAAAPTIKRTSGVLEDGQPSAVSSAPNADAPDTAADRGGLHPSTAALPPDPPAGTAGVLQLAVRLPDGRRAQRRFMDSDPVAAVEAWLRGEGPNMDQHVLSRQWPRKVIIAA